MDSETWFTPIDLKVKPVLDVDKWANELAERRITCDMPECFKQAYTCVKIKAFFPFVCKDCNSAVTSGPTRLKDQLRLIAPLEFALMSSQVANWISMEDRVKQRVQEMENE